VISLLELVAPRRTGASRPTVRRSTSAGSAVWGVRLAKRGWQVTGVDIVEKALERARQDLGRANATDMEGSFERWRPEGWR
jgi:hypothetical protein